MTKPRLILASMALTALAVVFAARIPQAAGQDAPADVAKLKDDLKLREQVLARQFAEFENSLLRLKDRLKRSGKKEDALRAEILEKVLEQSKDASISVQFEQMVDMLKNSKLAGIGDLKILDERSHKLADDLRDILTRMREDPKYSRLRDERLSLEKLIKEIERIIHHEKIVQGQTDRGKTDPKELKKNQAQVTKATGDLAKEIAKKDAKTGEPKNTKGDAKEGGKETKKGASKDSGSGKADGDSKQADAKPGQKSDGQGSAKSGGQSGPPKAGEKGDKQPPQPGQSAEKSANGKKQVDDAEYKMKRAEDNIAKKKNKDASDNQGEAITDLEKAKKKLEDLLRQIREEELERLLAALQARCEKMLAMQIQVAVGTEGIFRVVETLIDKKPNRQNQQDSLKLSDNEKDIVTEATKAIELLEAEGSAVAFPEVFHQVRQDMMHVQRRLEVTDAGIVTQAIEKDIIDTLKEMIEALKKARQELDAKKNPPSNSPPPPPQDQKLLELIAELKMIRSMQVRVNNRTLTYGRMYQQKEGEQTADPMIRRELLNLSERQERIFEVTNRIAKGDNK
jgi:hypothetical protein